MKRRGMSHIEIILAFLIFVSATTFVLYFFIPTGKSIIPSSLDLTANQVKINLTTSIQQHSIKIFPPTQDVSVPIGGLTNYKSSSYNLEGNRLNSTYLQEKAYIHTEDSDFIYLILSTDIVEMVPSSNVDGANYELGSTISRDVISQMKFIELNKSYWSEYDSLKENLKLPKGIDFGIVISSDDIIYTMKKDPPQNIEVYSKIVRSELLTLDGKLRPVNMEVYVW
jgi:hypothetical protein